MKHIKYLGLILGCLVLLQSSVKAQNAVLDSSVRTSDSIPRILIFAEQMPEFYGDLTVYIADHIKYPKEARKQGIEGKVISQFIIDENGDMDNIEIISSPSDYLSMEVVRMLQAMPKWKPGKQNGKPVMVKIMLPVMFKLNN